MNNEIYLPDVVGKGYREFWGFKGRYRVLKGGRASKKSCTAALWYIYSLMKYDKANLLVVRRYFNTHRTSTYTQLQWAMEQLGVRKHWKCTVNPMEMTYLPTGQKILFRGLDDPQSIASITVEKGVLCWVWIEEAFQVTKEQDFDKLDLSIRGETPSGYFKQHTLTFNPWSSEHWLKKRFFDVEDNNILAETKTYQCNEFIDDADIAVFDDLKRRFPRRYDVEGLGKWGVAEGLVYNNWTEKEFDTGELIKERPHVEALFGLDFGFTIDPSAFIALLIDKTNKELFVFDEFYERGLTNPEIAALIKEKGYVKERIVADCAEPKSIAELRREGIRRVVSSRKGPDSVRHGISYLQEYTMYIHPTCTNTIIELQNYTWDQNKDGITLNKPIDDYNHLLDAMRYAMESIVRGGVTVFK